MDSSTLQVLCQLDSSIRIDSWKMEQTSLSLILQRLWNQMGNRQARLPQNWLLPLKDANTILAELDTTIPSDFDTLRDNLQKIIKNWEIYYKDWSVTRLQHLVDKTSALLGDTLATSYSSEALNSIEKLYEYYEDKFSTIQESSLSGQTREIMSTSSMIAPTPVDNAGVAYSNTKSFADHFKSLLEESNMQQSSTKPTGRMFSYISECQNGRASLKFGLEEDYSDLRITIKLYDGNICKQDPEKYWKGKLRELDLTVRKDSEMAKTIENLFLRATMAMERKDGARLKKEPWQERGQSSNGSKRRFTPY